MNMLKRARQLIGTEEYDGDAIIIQATADREPPTAADRLAGLVAAIRQSSEIDAADIGTNIANAAKENTMTADRPVVSVTETLTMQMHEYADKVSAAIATIENEQKIADDVHSDALAALRSEIEQREAAHKELTAMNDARIADHKRALAGINALHTTINPPSVENTKPSKLRAVASPPAAEQT